MPYTPKRPTKSKQIANENCNILLSKAKRRIMSVFMQKSILSIQN